MLRRAGDLEPLTASAYRFDWHPIIAPFAGAVDPPEPSSTVSFDDSTVRWTFDPYPLTAGRLLGRVANGIRVLWIAEMLHDERLVRAWLAQRGSELLAARCTAGANRGVATEAFAALVAGPAGKAVYGAVGDDLRRAVSCEDRANLDSERTSLLLATFVADQLSTRPPITAGEIEALKRRLGIDTADT